MSVRAGNPVRQLQGGTSCGQIIESATDDTLWAVKLMGNRYGVTGLVNDLVGSRLAAALGLPVPDVGVMEISPSWARHNPELPCPKGGTVSVQSGPHFCSRYFADSQDVHAIGERFFRQASDLSWTPTLIGFDIWTLNKDRANNEGNLIAVGPPPWTIHVIDQGHCFGGPGWSTQTLRQRKDDLWVPNIQGSSVYRSMQLLWSKGDVTRGIETIRLLSADMIRTQIEDIPQEWLPEQGNELDALSEFLVQRRVRAMQFLEGLAGEVH